MIEHKYFRGFLITILVLFPGVSNLYKGTGSGAMVLLSLAGMVVIFYRHPGHRFRV